MAQKNIVEYILDIKTKAAEEGLEDVVAALEDIEKELKKTQKESKKTSASMEKMKNVGMALGKVGAVVAAVAVAVGAAGAAAFGAAKKVTDLTNELNSLSIRSGVSTKTLQGLKQALLASGQPAEGLEEILGAVSGQFAQLSEEGSAVQKNLESFGVAVKDASGEVRSNNDILLDSIKLLQGISDSSERSRAAVTLFGEAGAKLNQALAAGDFERFLSFTEKFGIDAGPEASRTAAQFQVVLSGLGTVLNGTLQKFVSATDGQNRFIQGMIKLGGILAFTGSFVESFSDEISFLTDKFLDLLNFGLRQMIALMGGPFTFVIGSAINALNLLGLEVEFLNKAMSNLAGFTLETIDPSNKLRNAIDKATEDMKEYEDTIGNINFSLDAFQTGSQGASNELNDLGKEAEKTTEKIRTLNDVVNDLLGRFIKIDIAKVLGDFNLIFSSLSFNLEKQFFQLRQNLQRILNPFGLLNQQEWMEFLSDPIKKAEFEAQKSQGRLKKLFAKGLLQTVTKTQDIFSNDFFRDFKLKFQNVLKGASEGGLLGAFQNLGKGGKAAAIIAGLFVGIFKAASKLGQRGETVAEIEKSVEQDIRARAKAIELGLQALPRILFNVLPPLLVEFADRIVFGFFKSIAEFVNILINGFKSIFTREGRQSLKEGIKEGFRESIEEFFRRVNVVGNILSKRSGGRYIPSARGGIKFTGADEGLAMLHRGEFVVPETGQMPQAVQRTMGMGQSGINITINASVVESNAVDELVRQIERRFQTFGSSTSPLFGGR